MLHTGLKGLALGLLLAGVWSVLLLGIYLFLMRKKPVEDATQRLLDDSGIVEAEVITKCHQDRKKYYRLALILGLAGSAAILLFTFIR